MQQGFQADLLKNALAGHHLQNHPNRKSQHGQTAIEQLGAVIKTPTLIPIHNPHVRLQRPGIVEAGLIRAPALPLHSEKLRRASVVSLLLFITPLPGDWRWGPNHPVWGAWEPTEAGFPLAASSLAAKPTLDPAERLDFCGRSASRPQPQPNSPLSPGSNRAKARPRWPIRPLVALSISAKVCPSSGTRNTGS
jgi:hypothetical protein